MSRQSGAARRKRSGYDVAPSLRSRVSMKTEPHFLRFARALVLASAGLTGAACSASVGVDDGSSTGDVVRSDAVLPGDAATDCDCPTTIVPFDSGATRICQFGTAEYVAHNCHEATGPLPPPEMA